MEFIKTRLESRFSSLGIDVCCPVLYASYPKSESAPFDFAVFFDKDIALAKHLERSGVKVINCAKTIEICDDKEKTFSALARLNINLPKTVSAPLMYDVNENFDCAYLDYVEKFIGYPAVFKENIGSQGRQVYLAKNRPEAEKLYERLKKIPHCIQEFVGDKAGEDIRVYIVGKYAVGSVIRTNTTDFRSNVAAGGILKRAELNAELKTAAENIADALNLEYGSVDFIYHKNRYYFIEANSGAYMKNAVNSGIELDKLLTDYIVSIL